MNAGLQPATRSSTEHAASRRSSTPVACGLVRAHGIAALFGVMLTGLFGLLTAYKFVAPDALGDVAVVTWGRLRSCHTQGVFFAWFGNVFLAFLYYGVPRLAAQPVTSQRLGQVIFVAWNALAVVPGWTLVLLGYSQPLEWAEFPVVVDVVAVIVLALVAVQFVPPFLKLRVAQLYVSSWYIVSALLFMVLAYPIGNFVPELMPGGMGAAFSSLWTHHAVDLFVTPLALSIAYYVIPAATQRPIYSHLLSLIGFWLLLAIAPFNGMHYGSWSPLSTLDQKSAVLTSVYLTADVCLVVFNLLMSMRGNGARIVDNVGLRFVCTGVVFYLLVSLLDAAQAVTPLSQQVQFTDWAVGRSHLAMLGFGSFVAIGGLIHAWEHTPSTRYSAAALSAAYWLLLVGLLLMVLDLTVAGLIQGMLWRDGQPWSALLEASRPYWLVRLVFGVCSALGFSLLALGLLTGKRHMGRIRAQDKAEIPVAPTTAPEALADTARAPEVRTQAQTAATPLWVQAAHIMLFTSGVAAFALSFLSLGLSPAQKLQAEMATAPSNFRGYSESAARGRVIYAREGCTFCHTQQVRPLDEDLQRYGPPTEPWETKFDTPHLWGTRRIGPDLSRESGKRADDWQLTHLYSPRLIVRNSVMPPFPWLFEGSPDKPRQEALDVVAYLQYLGRAKLQRERRNSPNSFTGSSADAMTCLYLSGDPSGPQFSASTFSADIDRGRAVFLANCAGCHGKRGDGRGPAASALWPHPADLTAAHFSSARISQVLWHGVPGTAMSSFQELSTTELKSLVAFVSSLGPKEPLTLSADMDILVRGQNVFTARCAACHGRKGAGDGPSARRLTRLPTDFTKKRPSRERARYVLEHGLPNTAMVPMAQNLSLIEEEAVIMYLRSLYRPTLKEKRAANAQARSGERK